VQIGLPLWLAFILAMLACGIIGIVLDFPGVPPLAQARRDRFAAIMSSIGAQHYPHEHALQLPKDKVVRFPFGLVPRRRYSSSACASAFCSSSRAPDGRDGAGSRLLPLSD